ncbi:MAG: HAD-IIIA family hydrolase [Elusimicrobia bacterium]|nr:HAD-IIIA family hydrolase [Elusimicrobiota bacterium]
MSKKTMCISADWEWIPGAVDGMGKMAGLGFRLVVVSNQSGVARGYYGAADVRALHAQVAEDLHGLGVEIAGFYFCPMGPAMGAVPKTAARFDLKGGKDLKIDLSRSFMVGDKLIDVQAAQSAGVQPILVGTGYGVKEKAGLPKGIPFVEDLLGAARWMEGL